MSYSPIKKVPRLWKSGVRKSNCVEYCSSATVANGSVTFYLTDNGLANGNPVFNNIYTESINIQIFDGANAYVKSVPVISQDRKSLTVNINKLGTVILGIIQFITAVNGTLVALQVKGDIA